MKRIFAIVLLIIVSVNLYSCDPDQYIIEPESLEKVENIELIEYNNPDQNSFFSWVPNHFDDLKPFNFSYSKVIETLPDDKYRIFCPIFQSLIFYIRTMLTILRQTFASRLTTPTVIF